MNLFDINESILNVMENLENCGDNLEFKQVLEDALGQLEIEEEKKVDSIAGYIKQLKIEADSIKEEAKKLQERAKAKEKKMEDLKSYIKNYLIYNGVKKFETTKNVISIKKNPAKVEVSDDFMAIHSGVEDFIKVEEIKKCTLDKKMLLTRLKNGDTIEGARIIQEERIDIK